MRILYIEDNPANVALVQRVARMGGHDILTYSKGETALENFAQDKPDLVLLDVQLEGELSGLDVARKLRADGHTMPVIAVTAYAMVGDKEKCLEAGCSGYLAKPLPVPELVQIIQEHHRKLQETSPAELTEQEKVLADAGKPTRPIPPLSNLDSLPTAPAEETPSSLNESSPATPPADTSVETNSDIAAASILPDEMTSHKAAENNPPEVAPVMTITETVSQPVVETVESSKEPVVSEPSKPEIEVPEKQPQEALVNTEQNTHS
jgi:CheY-like chemotaxis protein